MFASGARLSAGRFFFRLLYRKRIEIQFHILKLFIDEWRNVWYDISAIEGRSLIVGSFSNFVGHRIKKYRKSRGYTIEQFSAMINKSKATLSKYENGAITIDIETLYEISQALDIDLKYFVDYQPPTFRNEPALHKNAYFNQSLAYMYYYDGRVRQMVRSLLRFSPAPNGTAVEVTLYLGVASFDDPDRCQHLFTGEMKSYDTITHMVLNNQINEAEKMYICMLNPMQNRTPAIGLLSGIGSTPFFAPIALKTLISNEPLEESERLLSSIKLDKDDYHLLRYYNMMVINRPASLFLQ